MDLHLANGNLEHPLGLLENVVMESSRAEYKHIFTIMDFGEDPNYTIILDHSL